ncbi:hypothetical protein AA106555_0412 [Neokomagataea thailandica NBRC 106555]|uniref:DDE domain-containing protein n=1 Tax=Neokomagataea thailandica NBRC 106555 TaxID=1223520 RepID=A0ABQ0QN09_9PROT|nr:hypothetical protein AA106555_0412 [Neokomagataea thailandica NBRC 106555]
MGDLYRAVGEGGDMIDFFFSPTRNAKAAKRFLGKALNGLRDWEKCVSSKDNSASKSFENQNKRDTCGLNLTL